MSAYAVSSINIGCASRNWRKLPYPAQRAIFLGYDRRSHRSELASHLQPMNPYLAGSEWYSWYRYIRFDMHKPRFLIIQFW